jgi:Raf kinase inhibitor-like YbhB/YbcL family protein
MANNQPGGLLVSSPAFQQDGSIPFKYSCEGEEINPPLNIANIPHGTQTLAIIVEDPDAPKGTFDHWVVYNIPLASHIEENSVPGTSGINGAGMTGYHGPCPPSGSHRYYFYVYALDTELDLKAGSDKKTLQQAMEKHILAKGSLMGRYEKVKQKSTI